jgi:hypothetical protein
LEISQDTAPLIALYRYALKLAGIAPLFHTEAADPSILIRPTLYRDRVLYTLVSESGQPKSVSIVHSENHARIQVTLPPQRAAHILLDRATGQTLGSSAPPADLVFR